MREPSIRCTVVDERGTVSFTGPGHVLKVLAASCAKGADNLRTLLSGAERYNSELIQSISAGLAVFDEHNVGSDTQAFQSELDESKPYTKPFRVVDDVTRHMSMQPYGAGLVVFNLKARRIVQIQNSYAELQRQDRGRIREGGEPVPRLFHYTLPQEWSLVP